MTYTFAFLVACALIGAFAARAVDVIGADQRLGAIFGSLAVGAAWAAVWSWEKRQGVEP